MKKAFVKMDEAIIDFVTQKLVNKKEFKNVTDKEKRVKEALHKWLEEESAKAKNCIKASHVGKFTHPSTDVKASVFLKDTEKMDGFVRTGNIKTETDFIRSASYAKITKFLNIKLKNEKTVLEHLEENSQYIRDQLGLKKDKYDSIRKNLLKVNTANGEVTKSEIKQIYFPVDRGYHLLSVLTPSGIVLALSDKIEEMRRFSKQVRKDRKAQKKEEFIEKDFYNIYYLTRTSYGGSKPQNISDIATKLKQAYLFQSVPPQIRERNVKWPKYNFFKEILWVKDFEHIFSDFHKLQSANWNNQKIRKARDQWIESFLDRVLDKVWFLRQENPGWSDFSNKLPLWQKKWLDDRYRQERELSEFDQVLDQIIDDISRHFIFLYEKAIGKKKILLSDDVLKHVKNIVENNKEHLR